MGVVVDAPHQPHRLQNPAQRRVAVKGRAHEVLHRRQLARHRPFVDSSDKSLCLRHRAKKLPLVGRTQRHREKLPLHLDAIVNIVRPQIQ